MAIGPPEVNIRSGRPAGRCSAGLLAGALVAVLGVDQLLLWRFLDFAGWWIYPVGAALVGLLAWLAGRVAGRLDLSAPAAGGVALCIAVALLLFLLGGQGRLFYANIDWQVRDAILNDMRLHAWPFAYTARGVPELLRAPIGMYLVPALAGKALGLAAADVALLVQNGVMLGILLALASLRFDSARAAAGALAVFLAFSGMDVAGQLLLHPSEALPSHLEGWAQIQYSSHVTQAFWVPQHALSGWIAAALFLLWKDRGLPVGLLLGALPLIALWSPLGAIGALPFAAYAGWRAFAERTLRPVDFAFAAVATILAIPSLLYLGAAADSVGLHVLAVPLGRWFLFELLEVAPYLAAVAVIGARGPRGPATLMIVGVTLLILPFLQIGESIDLMMRGSIPALAILSVLVADALTDAGAGRRGWRVALALVLAIGSVTGLSEIRRAVTYRPSPRPLCGFSRAWDQSFGSFGKSTYLAPLAALPGAIRPSAPERVESADPPICWNRPWAVRRRG